MQLRIENSSYAAEQKISQVVEFWYLIRAKRKEPIETSTKDDKNRP